ncbi:putative RING finger protein [Aspergillus saccharolyticus JOP 1030-1]|uniref:RING-type domain-containing protein n=1 Tax=Aspergillus saccharolyticus JOP 1030-1 TaxID=1450539 RepID=A0A318ZKK0_9EURO|nr:hypothetical protein BP01DRAFT_389855 [Aspergillus saccharolyticus JOP 1030-1]PYH47305.1 hypothetical protein BP01DRAFT_389855 [Aspergillus saccharolyticus JOP 1030-1]
MISFSQAAIVGFLAPAAFLLLGFLIWGSFDLRRRRRVRQLPGNDPETAPIGSSRAVISIREVNRRFLTLKYSDWLAANTSCAPGKGIAQETVTAVSNHNASAEVTEFGQMNEAVYSNGICHDVPPHELSENGPAPDAAGTVNIPDAGDDPATVADPSHAAHAVVDAIRSAPGTEANPDMPNATKECVICMDEFNGQDVIRPLPCDHIFHSSCLDPWLTTRHACCPLCKASYCNSTGSRSGWILPRTDPAFPPAVVIRRELFPHLW